jgi:RND family efflux transporter MFP subunit
MRRFSGVVEAADTSNISFEVPGNVQKVKVEVGERVSKGQTLAVLDEKTYKLSVAAAQAAVGGAEVELADARSDLARLRRIAAQDRGAISERALEQAQATYHGAGQNLSYNTSRLNLAKRDLERTVLRAPFDGVIAERHVDPFQEVARGERMFDLFMEGAMQAAINIPESEIDQVHLGLPGEIRFPAVSGRVHKGVVTEISKVAGAANAFPVKVTIGQDAYDVSIRPGITAEVTLLLGDEQGEGAYLIPVGAVSFAGTGSENHVFVFDAETSTVKRTAIEDGGIRGSNIIVSKGLKVGDIIAVAGVSFLREGQKVRLMEQ